MKYLFFCGVVKKQQDQRKKNIFYLHLVKQNKEGRFIIKKIVADAFPLFIKKVQDESRELADILGKNSFSKHNGMKISESRQKIKKTTPLGKTEFEKLEIELGYLEERKSPKSEAA